MIQEFLKISTPKNESLLLFFSGWGGEKALFQRAFTHFPGDVMVVYDYTTLDFDFSMIEKYKSIHLVAWSMGVWVASTIFGSGALPALASATAINGTMHPIDDAQGIPTAIFNGTLSGLLDTNTQGVTLAKFRRRMCGTREGVAEFLALAPQRTPSALAGELESLSVAICATPPPQFAWQRAVVGIADAIFTAENQRRAWRGADGSVEVVEVEDAHFSERLFTKLSFV